MIEIKDLDEEEEEGYSIYKVFRLKLIYTLNDWFALKSNRIWGGVRVRIVEVYAE